VHYSTDYVFGRQSDRVQPYLEDEKTGPLNVYGVSKAAGEAAIEYIASRYYILRVCGLYGHAGSSGKGGNFVESMLKRARSGNSLRVVHDQVLTPTPTRLVAEKTLELLRTNAYGLYHMTAEGQCSWYEFTQKIMETAGIAEEVTPVSSDAFPSPVKRPQYSVLSKRKLAAIGIQMPSWQFALSEYIQARELRYSTSPA
jgi:dTDP-4-dehydrorhamnose reductase